MDDAQLLRTYAETGSETAFAEVFQRHLAMVSNASAAYVAGGSVDVLTADLNAAYQQAQGVLAPEQAAAMNSAIQQSEFKLRETQFFQQNGLLPPAPAKGP